MIDFELVLDIHVHHNKSYDRIIDQDLCFLCKRKRNNMSSTNYVLSSGHYRRRRCRYSKVKSGSENRKI